MSATAMPPAMPPPPASDPPVGAAGSDESSGIDPATDTTSGGDLLATLRGYFWFIAKNVIGWVLILASWPVGVALPGPGGLPLFLIGFALVTFPGKRRLTTRVMRGRRLPLEHGVFTFLVTAVSVLATVGVMWFLVDRYRAFLETLGITPFALVGVGLVALGVTWVVTWLGLRLANLMIAGLPRVRRFIRPWMRRKGLRLLPPRRRRVGRRVEELDEDEIILIDERHRRRLRTAWAWSRPWLARAVVVGLTVAAFVFILRPLVSEWETVRREVTRLSPARFMTATGMMVAFLLAFRVVGWRTLLAGLGHRLSWATAARVWSLSELARYVPGGIWQVVSRVMLVRRHGVGAVTASTSQVLELILFLLANVGVATAACLYFGWRRLDEGARVWFVAGMGLVPLLLIVLHPRVFYGVSDFAARLFGQPLAERRVGLGRLAMTLTLFVAGVLWQGLAVWVLTGEQLGLPPEKWWLVTGAYALAWTAGFLAIWSPAGLGVRELVLVLTLRLALPLGEGTPIDDPAAEAGMLAFLVIVLRLWVTAAEVLALGVVTAFGGITGGGITGGGQPPREIAVSTASQTP